MQLSGGVCQARPLADAPGPGPFNHNILPMYVIPDPATFTIKLFPSISSPYLERTIRLDISVGQVPKGPDIQAWHFFPKAFYKAQGPAKTGSLWHSFTLAVQSLTDISQGWNICWQAGFGIRLGLLGLTGFKASTARDSVSPLSLDS